MPMVVMETPISIGAETRTPRTGRKVQPGNTCPRANRRKPGLRAKFWTAIHPNASCCRGPARTISVSIALTRFSTRTCRAPISGTCRGLHTEANRVLFADAKAGVLHRPFALGGTYNFLARFTGGRGHWPRELTCVHWKGIDDEHARKNSWQRCCCRSPGLSPGARANSARGDAEYHDAEHFHFGSSGRADRHNGGACGGSNRGEAQTQSASPQAQGRVGLVFGKFCRRADNRAAQSAAAVESWRDKRRSRRNVERFDVQWFDEQQQRHEFWRNAGNRHAEHLHTVHDARQHKHDAAAGQQPAAALTNWRSSKLTGRRTSPAFFCLLARSF